MQNRLIFRRIVGSGCLGNCTVWSGSRNFVCLRCGKCRSLLNPFSRQSLKIRLQSCEHHVRFMYHTHTHIQSGAGMGVRFCVNIPQPKIWNTERITRHDKYGLYFFIIIRDRENLGVVGGLLMKNMQQRQRNGWWWWWVQNALPNNVHEVENVKESRIVVGYYALPNNARRREELERKRLRATVSNNFQHKVCKVEDEDRNVGVG